MFSERKKADILRQVYDFVQLVMAENDVAHDFSHVKRVVGLAKEISVEEPNHDSFQVELFALMHDINDHKLISHRKNAQAFLVKIGFLEKDATSILNILEQVSFSSCPKADSTFPPELCIVRDADRIDAIGAIGIARTFAYSGACNIPFYGGNTHNTIQHFQEKLLVLHKTLYYERSKTIAAKRVQIMQEFYIQFCNEAGISGEIEHA